MPTPARLDQDRRLSPLGRVATGTAVALAAMAAFNIAAARRAERRNPPRGRFVDAHGVRLHVVDRGSGPPVVMLHGNGSMAQEMLLSGVPDRLARNHRVLVFDRPGFGHSERGARFATPVMQARLIRRALRRMGVERPIIVGHSWGTLVALEMAFAEPEETAGLVLIGGYYQPTLRFDVPMMSMPAVPVAGDLLSVTLWPLLGRLMAGPVIARLFEPAPVTEHIRRGFPVEMAVRPSQLRAGAAEAAMMIPSVASMMERARGLTMPVVAIAGAGDRMVTTARHSAELDVDAPGSGFISLPDAGHMVHHTKPEHVAAAIERVANIAWPQQSFPVRQPEPVPPL